MTGKRKGKLKFRNADEAPLVLALAVVDSVHKLVSDDREHGGEAN